MSLGSPECGTVTVGLHGGGDGSGGGGDVRGSSRRDGPRGSRIGGALGRTLRARHLFEGEAHNVFFTSLRVVSEHYLQLVTRSHDHTRVTTGIRSNDDVDT